MAEPLVWATVREQIAASFGAYPAAQIEDTILDAFTRNAPLVIAEAKRVADDLKAGKITAGWPILRARLANSAPRLDAVGADPTAQLAKARAEAFTRNTGSHYTWQELRSYLFDPYTGLARDLARDDAAIASVQALHAQICQQVEQAETRRQAEQDHDKASRVPMPVGGSNKAPESRSISAPESEGLRPSCAVEATDA